MFKVWQCVGCSAWQRVLDQDEEALANPASCGKCGVAQPPADAVKYSTFTLRTQCVHCGGPLPLLGPLRSVHCDSCQKETTFSANEWGRFLWGAAMGFSEMNIGRHTLVRGDQEQRVPVCGECRRPMALDALPLGSDTTVPCAHCKAALTTQAAPAWLVAELPGLIALYGAARDGTDPAGLGAAQAPSASGPIVMACPRCGGALELGPKTERTPKCRYCNVDVYLPDEIWRRLHPVKTVRAWSVAYRGRALLEREDAEREAVRDKEREAARERQRVLRDAGEQARARAEAEQLAQAEEAFRRAAQRPKWPFVILALIVVAGVAIIVSKAI